ncbi:MAG: hypothetical protein ABJF04_20570 [Reichenbachiella sp.]|uniref:hypothetical protein n=1 Tax=Reichenbachiella sp. TaxID=2184521 RepID=UPI003267F8E5
MHLIWYNSVTKKYEYGSSREFKSLKKNSELGDALTILMEFTGDDKVLATKIIGELNIAKGEPLMVV